MINTIVNILKSIVNFLKYPVIIIIIIIAIFLILVYLNIILQGIKGNKIKRSHGFYNYIKKRSFFLKIFFDAPKQYALDIINRQPGFFQNQGLIIYEGRQGSGKTTSIIHDTLFMQSQYPKVKCISNIDYKYQNDKLKHWKQLINYKNGIYGVIVIMDELQNWFSSNQSKNFPPEMLSVITQNRKNRRIILGTAQSFHLLAKSIRSQCTEVRSCITFLGCITFVKRKMPILNSDGDVQEWKNRGFYWYVHNEKIRNSFDTWSVVKNLTESGFQEKDYTSNSENIIKITNKKLK